MNSWKTLMHLVGGHRLPEEEDGPARRMQIVALAAMASAGLCAMYGFAAGAGGDMTLAVSNLYKMPMVVLLSAVGAIPAGLLTWKLVGSESRASDLVVGAAAGTLSGSLILAVLAPLVALYYVTSSWLGPVLALGAASVATLAGLVVMARAVLCRVDELNAKFRVLVPVAVMMVIQLATLAQLIALAAPILYEQTVFDGGMDAILGS